MTEERLSEPQKLVNLNDRILRRRGHTLDKAATILDFGCGGGRHTYEYLNAGYAQAFGFDVKDYTGLLDRAESGRFRFLEPGQDYRIPFPDDHFDFILSASVFEHVANQAETIAEIARILKPGGVTLHIFPARWRPIETHFFVPFGGAIQARWWLALWAHLGIRNAYQRDMTAAEVTSRNLSYCATGINYLNTADIDTLWGQRFASVEFAEADYIECTRSVSTISRMAYPMAKLLPGFINLYRNAHTRVVLASRPR